MTDARTIAAGLSAGERDALLGWCIIPEVSEYEIMVAADLARAGLVTFRGTYQGPAAELIPLGREVAAALQEQKG